MAPAPAPGWTAGAGPEPDDREIETEAQLEAGGRAGERLISVAEIYGPVLHGEGPVLGEPTVVVRTGGCDSRCSWCDSLHAVMPAHRDEWEQLTSGQTWVRLRRLAPRPILVTLTGGNPALQPFTDLIRLGHATGYGFCVETQGTAAPDWLRLVDIVILSPKPPSSGMAMRWDRFQQCVDIALESDRPRRELAIEIPIFNAADLDWLERVITDGRLGPHPLYLSVGNPLPPPDEAAAPDMNLLWERGSYSRDAHASVLLRQYEWLAGEILRRGIRARVTPKMNTLTYSNRRGS